MPTVLGFWDFFWIWCLVSLAVGVYAGGTAYARLRAPDAARLRRLEAKVDLILKHLGLEYKDPSPSSLSEEVKALARDPARKLEAIKLHREQTGAGLLEAKTAVEAYVAERG